MTSRSPQAGRMERLLGWLPSAKPRTSPNTDQFDRTASRTWRNRTALTPAELSFLHLLTRVVDGRFLILTKTRMADLFGLRRNEESLPAFDRIGRQHVDFVLCDPRTSEMLAAIEVDDRPLDHPDRVDRDRFMDRLFAWNRLPLIRIPSTFIYAPEKLRRELARALGDRELQAV